MTRIALALLYVASIIFSVGSLNANIIGQHWLCSTSSPRQTLATAVTFWMLPVANVAVAVLATGFMEHGWRLKLATCGSDGRAQ